MAPFNNVSKLAVVRLSGVLVLALAGHASAHDGHQHGAAATTAAPPALVASTAKPFAALMNDAMAVMDYGMRTAPMSGQPEHDFVTMMMPHHQGAVDMAKALLLTTRDAGLRNLAQGILAEQQIEIQLMQAWLDAHPAAPAAADRVYTADQNTNTISVIDPLHNKLLGQIALGSARPEVLSPLYRGHVNVHGLGFSPDHKTLIAIANGSNSVTFIDTATNQVKGRTYVGRSPHEGFFSADGKEVWVVVRGEDYISVIDASTYKETARIPVADGPGMVQFLPDGKLALVVSSFTPEVDVIEVATRRIVKRIPVLSPFSPFLQFTPDFKEVWMTHKDVGKVTRIDTRTLEVTQVIDTGLVTNHLGFARTARGTLAYVSVGAENVVKVYSTGPVAQLVGSIATGALPHGVWPSDDGSRVYVGLENGDAVDVIDTASDKVVARVPVGQAPQALVYLSNVATPGKGEAGLVPRVNQDSVNLPLTATGAQGTGFVVLRKLGLADSIEAFLYKLKPQTVYDVFIEGEAAPVGSFRTSPAGMANGTAIGPLRKVAQQLAPNQTHQATIYVTEHGAAAGIGAAVLRSR